MICPKQSMKVHILKASIYFGRFQPVHAGHEHVVRQASENAVFIGASRRQSGDSDPLSHGYRISLLKKVFHDSPNVHIIEDESVTNTFNLVEHVASLGYDDITILCGVDRTKDYKKLKGYIKGQIEISVSPFSRYHGLSATEMREYAITERFNEFRDNLPDILKIDVNEIFNRVRDDIRSFSSNKGQSMKTIRNTPPAWEPDALPSQYGWVHPKTGELLVSVPGGCTLEAPESINTLEVIDETVITSKPLIDETVTETSQSIISETKSVPVKTSKKTSKAK